MIWVMLLLLAVPAAAEGLAVSTPTAVGSVSLDPFAAAAAKRLSLEEKSIAELRRKGFGKTEIFSFAAIAKASKKTWDELVKERQQGASLRKMAEEAGLDYNAVFERSSALRDEIDKGLEKNGPSRQN